MQQRNHTVDSIKGIAILFVVIAHYPWNHEQLKNPIFPYLIDMAVPIFMIISGYVYSGSYGRKKIHNFHEAYNVRNVLDKIVRYTIPFVVIAIYQLIDSNVHLNFESPLNFIRWFLIGTMGQGSYYYPVIIQFIFVFPILFFLIREYRLFGLKVCFIITLILEVLSWAYNMNDDCYRLLIIRYLFAIAVGIYGFKNEFTLTESLSMIFIGGVYIAIITYTGYTPVLFHGWQGTSVFASLYIAPISIYILRSVKIKILPLELIGKASYHIFLVQMCYYLTYRAILSEMIKPWQLCFILGVLISISLGIIFYFIETKISRFILSQLRIRNSK